MYTASLINKINKVENVLTNTAQQIEDVVIQTL